MRHNARRDAFRHIIALLLLLPFLATRFLRTEEHRWHLTWLDDMSQKACAYIGDFAFALTGTLAGGMEGMDILGCIVIGFVTSMGGGTLRDILLGRFPIFWLTAYDEFSFVVVVSVLTFFFWPPISSRFYLTASGEWLFWCDTMGLGVYAASGASIAVQQGGLHIVSCAFCGMCTATFGGLTRDVLLGRPPRILYPMLEVYAFPAFSGAFACALYMRLVNYETVVSEAIMLGLWITVYMRVLAVNHGIRLPTFPAEAVYSKEARPRCAAAEIAAEEDKLRLEESHAPEEERAMFRAATMAAAAENRPRGSLMFGRSMTMVMRPQGSVYGDASLLRRANRVAFARDEESAPPSATSSVCSEVVDLGLRRSQVNELPLELGNIQRPGQ